MLPHVRRRVAALAVVALIASAIALVAPVGAVAAGSDTRPVAGFISFPGNGKAKAPKVRVLWFTRDWQYLGQKKANGGSYALNLVPGTYWLQFVDQTASYRTDKYAPTDVKVTVRADRPTVRDVRMKRGAFVTGKVTTPTGPGRKARVAVARTLPSGQDQSFDTTANRRGEFAIGGLPEGKWSVFAWDRAKRWTGKSVWAGKVRTGRGTDVRVPLRERAGSLRVLLYTPDGSALAGRTTVTVTSLKTGQWWTATARGGTAVFPGVHPGRYRLKFDGAGNWLADEGRIRKAQVRPGRPSIGTFEVRKRGGWITGQAVDAGAPAYPLGQAQVQLYDVYGTKIDETTSSDSGWFTLDGQLATQRNMTVVINPRPDRGGYVQTVSYCRFDSKSVTGVSVAQGKETRLGAVGVARTPGQSPPC
ncbi:MULTISPECIES: MSCRAMM family protein [unclassified Nocardioides]|uniref:MSCRAMM family protein n=1 Tax=unclassified Nocardioides TaxID=2615069 RepID=UPI00361AF673